MKKLINGIKNLVIGLLTTGKHLGRHAITIQYPTQKWEMPERSRGIVVLLSDKETGELNCTTCLLCEKACPSSAIKIVYEKDEKGKRHLKDFIVDHGLCCFCGLCEEACNFSAIKLATKYEFSTYTKDDLLWHTNKLQEVGRDVPYEKVERKKPEAKPAAPQPTTATPSKPIAEKQSAKTGEAISPAEPEKNPELGEGAKPQEDK